MNIFTVYAFFVALFPGVGADRWFVSWVDMECVSQEEKQMPFWSVVYTDKKDCCAKVFWWKDNCEATDHPTPVPSSSPTPLRGSTNHPMETGDSGSFNSSGSNGGSFNGNAASDSSSGGSSGGGNAGAGTSSGKKNQGTMSFAAVADTYIRADRPEKNYGRKNHLIVGTDGETVTLIKFDIKRVKKRLNCISKATLNLYSLTEEENGGVINTYDPNIFTRDDFWDENLISWSNAPKERPYTYYKEIGRVHRNQWAEIDVTEELGTDRFVTFRVAGGKWNKYASKESRHPPILTVDLC